MSTFLDECNVDGKGSRINNSVVVSSVGGFPCQYGGTVPLL